MNSLNVLHLSDFHIGNFKYEQSSTLAIKIADTLEEHGRLVDIVLVTGDVFDGRSKTDEEDIEQAITFFNTLVNQFKSKSISSDSFNKNDILFVPGNHDLVRDNPNHYAKYDEFMEKLYEGAPRTGIKIVDKYNYIFTNTEKKIIILGFNSCRIEVEKIQTNELKWIDNLDITKLTKKSKEIKDKIRALKIAEKVWDDYGHIDPEEMDKVFTNLRIETPAYEEYTIVANFHHHFYPFPEITNAVPDASFIRNYPAVIEKFQKFKIQLVLHGHKHLSIQRAITDNKYFDNPESIIYVLSAGSVGYKDIYNPSFQWLKIFSKDFNKLAQGERYDYKNEQLDTIKEIILPPQQKNNLVASSLLLDILESESPNEYQNYNDITDNFAQIIEDSQVGKILEVVSKLITIFEDIKIDLRKNPQTVYVLLLLVNYRVILLKNNYKPENMLNRALAKLKKALLLTLDNSEFANNLLKYVSSKNNGEIDKNYDLIIKNVSNKHRRISAYASISLFMTDLFLNVSSYGEYYFDNEKLNHKVNIKLQKDDFYNSISTNSISIEGDIDRRAIIIDFSCNNPTVHKVAVLIVKDFEIRLNKFEESLKEIKLKLYYISPKVKPIHYDLENFHFDAYIPTLLPLLTGDNLYKQKEVFIRELVQNSIDATLLRRKLKPQDKFTTEITITLGIEDKEGKPIKFFKISDNGVGMSKFTIERYFTSIGRSFYVSDEFEKIKADNNITYNSISNFGIGFLSSFMVCSQILVKTKSLIEDDGTNGLEIEIPNYEGCFFIRKIDLDTYGTEIILYEDDRKLFDFDRFIEYVKATFMNIPVDIQIKTPETPIKNFTIPSFNHYHTVINKVRNLKEPIFYIPFSETAKTSNPLTWNELIDVDNENIDKFGITLDFNQNSLYQSGRYISKTLNQGLLISELFIMKELEDIFNWSKVTINFPSSFIQLDVSRDKVKSLKTMVDIKNVPRYVYQQINEFLDEDFSNKQSCTIYAINYINSFANDLAKKIGNRVKPPLLYLKATYINGEVSLTIESAKLNRNIINNIDNKNILYFIYNEKFIENILNFTTYVNKEEANKFPEIYSLAKRNNPNRRTSIKSKTRETEILDSIEHFRDIFLSSHLKVLHSIFHNKSVNREKITAEENGYAIGLVNDIFSPTFGERMHLYPMTKPSNFSFFDINYEQIIKAVFSVSAMDSVHMPSKRSRDSIDVFEFLYLLQFVIFRKEFVQNFQNFNLTFKLSQLVQDTYN